MRGDTAASTTPRFIKGVSKDATDFMRRKYADVSKDVTDIVSKDATDFARAQCKLVKI